MQIENAAAVLSVLGIAASVFIGFRNTNAYNRWWEARTLWGSIIINSRATHNGLCSVDTGARGDGSDPRTGCAAARFATPGSSPPSCAASPPVAGVAELTPEDPADASAIDLMTGPGRRHRKGCVSATAISTTRPA